ncbi:MAG: carboxymuconolactone decarboxylase family protein [Gammaproteobacteria bacterium]
MQDRLCWIDAVGYENADEALKSIYDAVRSPAGDLDNLYQAFSLTPHTIKPAHDLYRAVLHHPGNRLPKWFSELIATFVAMLADCEYALTHHGRNFAHLLGDPARAEAILKRLREGNLDDGHPESWIAAQEVSALAYARKLCLEPERVDRADVEALSDRGWSDGEILEIVQIVATFSYFVRVINGVGISLRGERIGLY